jgi:hypothetical protein
MSFVEDITTRRQVSLSGLGIIDPIDQSKVADAVAALDRVAVSVLDILSAAKGAIPKFISTAGTPGMLAAVDALIGKLETHKTKIVDVLSAGKEATDNWNAWARSFITELDNLIFERKSTATDAGAWNSFRRDYSFEAKAVVSAIAASLPVTVAAHEAAARIAESNAADAAARAAAEVTAQEAQEAATVELETAAVTTKAKNKTLVYGVLGAALLVGAAWFFVKKRL